MKESIMKRILVGLIGALLLLGFTSGSAQASVIGDVGPIYDTQGGPDRLQERFEAHVQADGHGVWFENLMVTNHENIETGANCYSTHYDYQYDYVRIINSNGATVRAWNNLGTENDCEVFLLTGGGEYVNTLCATVKARVWAHVINRTDPGWMIVSKQYCQGDF